MSPRTTLLAYAALNAANGIYRQLSDPERGRTGCGFGLSMAAIAVASAMTISRPSRAARVTGAALAVAAIAMTGGFFTFAVVAKPDEYGVVRPAIMMLASVAAVALLVGARCRTAARS